MRVSEIYASAQGEGPNVGKTTVFVRFGGCNLRCPGWPCDTQHAIDPAYRNEWEILTPEETYTRIRRTAEVAGANTITLTGGEPFLQPDTDMLQLVRWLSDHYDIDCFSNGTIAYPNWAPNEITFIMDWKLPGSGETKFGPENATRLLNLNRLKEARRQQCVKFVIKDYDDYIEAKILYNKYLSKLPNISVYYGRVWESDITNADLVGWVMRDKLPWLLNVQMHNYIWPANERGR
jgi:7-carboxy-7-deazaguanine synthase